MFQAQVPTHPGTKHPIRGVPHFDFACLAWAWSSNKDRQPSATKSGYAAVFAVGPGPDKAVEAGKAGKEGKPI